jgi:RNA polymerase sigma-70 factor (ECF subfamily)
MVGPAEEAPAARGEPRSDEALVEAANRGDEAAFEALYIRHRDYVLRLAYRFTGSSHDALDVLQDAFSYLLGKFPGFTLSARMTTFLYPVVRSLSMDVLRRRRPHLSPEQAEADLPAAPPPPADPAAVRSELADALSALPAEQREVLLMRYVDDMSLGEIAEALDIPVGTVKSRVHYALRALRDDERTRRYFGR